MYDSAMAAYNSFQQWQPALLSLLNVRQSGMDPCSRYHVGISACEKGRQVLVAEVLLLQVQVECTARIRLTHSRRYMGFVAFFPICHGPCVCKHECVR